ncbi:MAG: HAMP domain-containing protein, partial [Magnetococcales bacterium]|nr:HAMP domain-containing protein [Magnetococcales bacterium]
MKLQTKLILSFLLGLVVVISLAQIIQYNKMTGIAQWMAQSNAQLVREMVEKNAINTFHTVERAVAGSLQKGEMDKFDRLVREQSQVPGLLEFSLYDSNGRIYSSTALKEQKMPDRHPKKVEGKVLTDNCLRCHQAEDVNLKSKKIPGDLMGDISKKREPFVRQSHDTIEIFQTLTVTSDCIRCHRDWKEGNASGFTHFQFSKKSMLELEEKMAAQLSQMEQQTLNISLAILLGIILVLTPLAYQFTRINLVLRLKELGDRIHAMARGDLSKRIPVPERLDEISAIAVYVNTMADNLANTAKAVGQEADTVAGVVAKFNSSRETLADSSSNASRLAAEALSQNENLVQRIGDANRDVEQAAGEMNVISTTADQLANHVNGVALSAEQADHNVATMASAAEEMTANLQEVNRGLGQVTQAVGGVASAIHEMTQSIQGVRSRCQAASKQSRQADAHAKETAEVMNRLSASAGEIDKVVEVINSIAEQTNMLALNAAIEAAGAGDAGKGFAVVANEVKELARQTTEATRMIDERIGEMRSNATSALSSAREIANLV